MATENRLTSLRTPIRPFERDIRLDALRGLFLIMMTCNHLSSILRVISDDWFGYVTAAEGFVFLSGFVSGMTYTRVSLLRGESEVCRRASSRARTIYLFHIGTFIVLFFALREVHSNANFYETWQPLFVQSTVVSLLMGATFLSQPYFLDVLPLYCVLVFAAPYIIAQFKRGNAFLVIGASILLWIVDQFHVTAQILSSLQLLLPVCLGVFDFLAWQALFIVGLYCGHKYYINNCHLLPISKLLTIYAGVVVVVLFLCRHNVFSNRWLSDVMNTLADKTTLGMVRMLNFSALCVLVASFGWSMKYKFLFSPLAYLGRNSLQVFAYQIFLVYVIKVVWGATGERGLPTGRLMAAACITSLYLPAWISEQLRVSRQTVLIR